MLRVNPNVCTAVVCNTSREVIILQERMLRMCKEAFSITEHSSDEEIGMATSIIIFFFSVSNIDFALFATGLAKSWPSGKAPWPLLIGTEELLLKHGINTAVQLIHFSVSPKFKDFAKRFQIIWPALVAYLNGKGPRPISNIIIAENEYTDSLENTMREYLVNKSGPMTVSNLNDNIFPVCANSHDIISNCIE